ncbi:UDP-N-acetylmuramoylalanine--D-glutamate ligase [hydrothermal vent metagenome]|uniref:UDP-N-acetylmuramoylalanine--D-glutamate ligase n=1 Tax=hydrothermal vent metagenome TaxID=652676 RepID=A0A1W1C5U1_9ZZZZ
MALMKNFNELREQNNQFIYKSYAIKQTETEIVLEFLYVLREQHETTEFHHRLSLPLNEKIDTNFEMDNILFHIGMAEAISYYKIAAPKTFIIECGTLTQAQKEWFSKLYFNGLGEFIYLNKIDVTQEDLVDFVSLNTKGFGKISVNTQENNIIPIGGGKDSLVSYELLKSAFPDSLLFSMNPIVASQKILDKHPSHAIRLKRELDLEKIFTFNKRGYLNGHIPFSSIVGFISIWLGLLYKTRYIVLSNEASANEENIIYNGQKINHQYSKSLEFENDFRAYVSEFITEDVEYFSFLRPLDEIHIAKLFSEVAREHFFDFRSCNVGSKKNEWCGKCPKCLFTYIMLCNYINDATLVKIFGKNILDDAEMQELFDGLSKSDEVKPFECVGTYDEVNYALTQKYKAYKKEELPYLLKNYQPKEMEYDLTVDYDKGNNLPQKFKEVLREYVERLNF